MGFLGYPEDSAVFITGAGSGIGRACAKAFGRLGVRVAVSDRDVANGEQTAQLVVDAGGEAECFPCDVTDPEAVAAAVSGCRERFGGPSLAVNSAGIVDARPAPVDAFAVDDYDTTMAINLRGVFLSMKSELRAMRADGAGAIVNIASGAGLVAILERPSYNASKHGVIGLTRNAALDYAPLGVRVNAVCPGIIDTPMAGEGTPEAIAAHPIGRIGTPDEIAAAAVWLCSPSASFVTGVAMPVDGGYTLP